MSERNVRLAEAAREEAMDRVDGNTSEAWKLMATGAIAIAAHTLPDFTPDDVWDRLAWRPREPRALGPVMRRVAKAGLIVPTGEWRPSERPSQHRTPIRVWRRATL